MKILDHKNKARRVKDEDGNSIPIDGETLAVVAKLKGQARNSPKEHHINANACDALNAIPGCVAHKVVGTVYAKTGQPDIIACYRGQMYCMEGKVRVKETSTLSNVRPNQRACLRRWTAAGARVGFYTSTEEAVAILAAFERMDKNRQEEKPIWKEPLHEYWLWFNAKRDEVWRHIDEIPMRD